MEGFRGAVGEGFRGTVGEGFRRAVGEGFRGAVGEGFRGAVGEHRFFSGALSINTHSYSRNYSPERRAVEGVC